MARQRFLDRKDAGARLVKALAGMALEADAVVLGLPRGGVPVGEEIARRLNLQLDFLNIRKMGVPWQPEVAMGAVGEDGIPHLNSGLVESLAITPDQIRAIRDQEMTVIRHRKILYRRHAASAVIQGRQVILVDDGLATGSTMDLAIEIVKKAGARSVIVALPVAPAGTVSRYEDIVDHCVCLQERKDFGYVGRWYSDFNPVSDDQVCESLDMASREPGVT